MSLFRSAVENSSDSDEASLPNEAAEETSNGELSPSTIAGPLANLDPFGIPMDTKEMTSLFYISLIEQRCKDKAAESLGLPKEHPNVRKSTNYTSNRFSKFEVRFHRIRHSDTYKRLMPVM